MLETITEQLLGKRVKLKKTTTYTSKGEAENTYTIDCPPGLGPVMSDTDSVASRSRVKLNGDEKAIEEHFEKFSNSEHVEFDGKKETIWFKSNRVFSPCYDPNSRKIEEKLVKGIYRHKVTKARYRITLESGSMVDVTDDHSIMVERYGKLIEVKPNEINTDTDICIRYRDGSAE